MTSVRPHYRPEFGPMAGPVAQSFIEDRSFVSAIMGPLASGKTTACIRKIFASATDRAWHGDNSRVSVRWAVVAPSVGFLLGGLLPSWRSWMPSGCGQLVPGHHPKYILEIYGPEFRPVVEIEVIFLALDAAGQCPELLAMELTGVWIASADMMPECLLSMAMGRVGRFPRRSAGGSGTGGVIMDALAPECDDHWLYRRLETIGAPAGVKFFKQPSGRSPQAENLHNLPPGYYERAMLGQPPRWVRRFIDGESCRRRPR